MMALLLEWIKRLQVKNLFKVLVGQELSLKVEWTSARYQKKTQDGVIWKYAAAALPRPQGYEKSFGRTFTSLLGRLRTHTWR